MATSLVQYTPVFLPGEPPPWQRRLAGHSLQCRRVGHYWSDPACIVARLSLPVAALPPWELAWRWHGCLACGDPGGAKCAGTQAAFATGAMALSESFPASCSWQSEGLFGQSSSVAPPFQALRRLPCPGSFSVVQPIRYLEGHPWLGSYAVDWCLRHLKGHPGWGPTL